jgi:hypothetical protein
VIVAEPEPKYALEAFRIQAVDFVSKPASREDLWGATVRDGMRFRWLDHWFPRWCPREGHEGCRIRGLGQRPSK